MRRGGLGGYNVTLTGGYLVGGLGGYLVGGYLVVNCCCSANLWQGPRSPLKKKVG